MTSLPPPPPPPTVPDAVSASSSSSDNNNNNNNYGPVTKLAHLAAAQEEETRREKRRQEQANLRAQASLVGETALAIAAATASGSPVRLSPQQLQAGGISPGKRVSPIKQYYLQGTTPPRRSMSVAARARAAADLPSRPPPMPPAGGGDDNNNSRAPMQLQQQQQRAPSSGNAGVSRGKFSKAQVKQMVDEWGREDTSEDDYDDDYYYDVTSDSSAGGELSNDAADDEQYKQSLQRAHHHLQYTMSHSPGPTGVEAPEEAAAMAAAAAQAVTSETADGFHYQHHRVSAYSNSKRASITGTQPGMNHPQSHEEESGGIFASAKNWLQSQRERLHQLELERQVEDQRRKLVVEGRKQRALEAERRRRNNHIDIFANTGDNSIADGTAAASGTQQQQGEIPKSQSFGCIDNQVGSAETEDGELCNIPEQGAIVTGMPNLCGFGGVYAHQLTDDSTDYSGVARVDSQGNILELIPSGSLDGDEESGEHLKVCMMVSSPKFTVSGKGMSVKVDLPDDNEYREDGGEQRSNDIDNKDNSNSNNMKADKDFNRHDSTGSRHFEVVEQGVIEEDNSFFISDIKIVPEQSVDDISYSPPILHPSQMKSLIASGALPPSLTFCKWKRLYSLNRDGDSFEQFLRLVEGHDRTVLVVKTMQGNLFGGYADTRWEARHVRRHASEFYGSAQACLFRFPNFVSPRGSGNGHEDKIIIYKWSGANRYIQLCDAAKRTLAFGGGGDEGDFGLCIEDDFRRGTTGHCSTFENEALCEEGYFDVMDLEVWGFTLDF